MDDIVEGYILLLIAVVLIVGMVGLAAVVTGSGECNQLTQLDPDHTYHYGFWTGCIVQLDNGRWVDVDDYQQIQLEMEK